MNRALWLPGALLIGSTVFTYLSYADAPPVRSKTIEPVPPVLVQPTPDDVRPPEPVSKARTREEMSRLLHDEISRAVQQELVTTKYRVFSRSARPVERSQVLAWHVGAIPATESTAAVPFAVDRESGECFVFSGASWTTKEEWLAGFTPTHIEPQNATPLIPAAYEG